MIQGLDETEVLRELTAREPIFHQPAFGTARTDYERMTAPDYWEVGASGRVYELGWVLDELERRQAAGEPEAMLEATEFKCRRLGEACWLLTYNLVQGGMRRTRRSTVWEWVEGEWRIVYHQGTIVLEDTL